MGKILLKLKEVLMKFLKELTETLRKFSVKNIVGIRCTIGLCIIITYYYYPENITQNLNKLLPKVTSKFP